jgi:DNA-binding MarR family transcriptional regulator
VDDVAIARAVAGMAPDGLTLAEQLAAVRILTERGASARQIAERLQVTPRTVTRHRSRLRALGPDWAVAA